MIYFSVLAGAAVRGSKIGRDITFRYCFWETLPQSLRLFSYSELERAVMRGK